MEVRVREEVIWGNQMGEKEMKKEGQRGDVAGRGDG